MKFNIDDYNGTYVMHCKTVEEDKSFREYLHSVGRKWFDGDSYLSVSRWHLLKNATCYNFNINKYDSIDYYKGKNFTILEWSDFMNNEFTKADLKNGDVIQRRNGWVEIVCFETDTCITPNGFNLISDIRDDLTDEMGKQYDIVAVRRPTQPKHCQFCAFKNEFGELVYERKEVEEMTLEEVCKALGKEIKIVKEH